jgi:transcriptional regulator with XRE-family HTH domain
MNDLPSPNVWPPATAGNKVFHRKVSVEERAASQVIARVIRDSGIHGRKLAEDAGISESALSFYRTSRRRPSHETLSRLARALERRGEFLKMLAAEIRKLCEEVPARHAGRN